MKADGFDGLVVDAFLTAAWCFEDEETKYARDVLRGAQDISFLVPPILPVEMVNVLLVNERRQRITASDTMRAVTLFMELALRESLPIATLKDACAWRPPL